MITELKKIELKNGLTLEFIDVSRKIAGDRYRVSLKTRVVVPVVVAGALAAWGLNRLGSREAAAEEDSGSSLRPAPPGASTGSGEPGTA